MSWTEATAGVSEFVSELEARAGVKFFDHQQEAFAGIAAQAAPVRACLYYKTGAGKTLTGLVTVAESGYSAVLVLAPPSTHKAWQEWGTKIGVEVDAISHAKFRQKDYKISRDTAVIVDEFHLLGGHGGKGWKKMDTMARHLKGPLIIMSATPNYNDAERVYCIQHVLDPHSCRGGYLEFLYRECETEQDPFSQTPKVLGFWKYPDAAAYLAALPYVYYLPDDLVWSIDDIEVWKPRLPELDEFGYDPRSHRVMASGMEERHKRIFYGLVDESGYLRDSVMDVLEDLISRSKTPVLVYADHATVAAAADKSLAAEAAAFDGKVALVTGDTPAKKKEARIQAFRDGVLDVLVGTASLATGTDGLDKMCDCLIILDDTPDDSLRRQLVGRIMPRGEDADASNKRVHRIVLT